jgi:hypothetical protein
MESDNRIGRALGASARRAREPMSRGQAMVEFGSIATLAIPPFAGGHPARGNRQADRAAITVNYDATKNLVLPKNFLGLRLPTSLSAQEISFGDGD